MIWDNDEKLFEVKGASIFEGIR